MFGVAETWLAADQQATVLIVVLACLCHRQTDHPKQEEALESGHCCSGTVRDCHAILAAIVRLYSKLTKATHKKDVYFYINFVLLLLIVDKIDNV